MERTDAKNKTANRLFELQNKSLLVLYVWQNKAKLAGYTKRLLCSADRQLQQMANVCSLTKMKNTFVVLEFGSCHV